jgi:tetratricopeptide (TPR) repeat protein
LTAELKNNLQYGKEKRELTATIAERWHLFSSIMSGDDHMESGSYQSALKAYQDARDASYEVYREAGTHSGLMVSEILSEKTEQAQRYIEADALIKIGDMYEIDEMYHEALSQYRDADEIIRALGDLAFNFGKEVCTVKLNRTAAE